MKRNLEVAFFSPLTTARNPKSFLGGGWEEKLTVFWCGVPLSPTNVTAKPNQHHLRISRYFSGVVKD